MRNQSSGLLGEAREDNLDMNVIIYNSAISVCGWPTLLLVRVHIYIYIYIYRYVTVYVCST